jgi:hypothetical protein
MPNNPEASVYESDKSSRRAGPDKIVLIRVLDKLSPE